MLSRVLLSKTLYLTLLFYLARRSADSCQLIDLLVFNQIFRMFKWKGFSSHHTCHKGCIKAVFSPFTVCLYSVWPGSPRLNQQGSKWRTSSSLVSSWMAPLKKKLEEWELSVPRSTGSWQVCSRNRFPPTSKDLWLTVILHMGQSLSRSQLF